ncbi:MAG TPA: hypothetical protein VLK22_02115 [Candidatus Udaeobacter sp.]|nr:hypothetical protein [Candidatus Udaeobacter sp.]
METVTSLHLHEFFIEGNNPETSHVLLNITEPSTPAEKEKGYFFAICEINNATTKYIARMQSVIDEIENNYYEIPNQTEQTAMEIVLEKINQENLSLAQPDISLHCIVGAIRENDIIFSFYGDPQMVLFYKTKDGSYKKIDLVEENKPSEPNEKTQLFSQIIQGKIGPNDFFFAGTPHIAEYFSQDRLEKIITTRPPKQSSEHLQRVLSDIKNDLSFGGIIINLQSGNTPPIMPKTSPVQKGSSDRSLKTLFSTEKNTSSLLSPSFLPKFEEDIIDQPLNKENVTYEMMGQPIEKNIRTKAEITSSHLHVRMTKNKNNDGANLQNIIKTILIILWKIIKYTVRWLILIIVLLGTAITNLGKNLLLLIFVATNYQNRRHNILAEWGKWWRQLGENLARLPLITKILLIFSFLLFLSFSGGIFYLRTKQQKDARTAAYHISIQNITTKADTAESSLVYNNTETALTNILAAEKILKDLPCLTSAEKTDCKNLENRLNNLLIKARKITLAKPQLLIDWSGLAKSAQLSKIFLLRNKIYGFGFASTNIITYDPLIKESNVIVPSISLKKLNAVSVPKENDYAALLYDDKSIAQFRSQDNSWRKIDVDYPNQNATIANISVYNRKLYTLDTKNNQIYKHDSIKTGFALGKEWLKSNSSDLNNSIDFAVDGDIFALKNNGSVAKFTTGAIAPFTITELDPELTSADEIWTYNDLSYIYILDGAGKRIIILDKMGQLKKQIIIPEFSHPVSMVIDELKSVAYVLDSNKVYLVEL